MPQAPGHSFELDNSDGGTQATDREGLDAVMDILVDISRFLEVIE